MKIFTLLASALVLLGCSETVSGGGSDQVAGGGSDHPNEILGLVKNGQETPISAARIVLLSKDSKGKKLAKVADFTPVDTTMSNAKGEFQFDSIDSGHYSIEVSTTTGLVSYKDGFHIKDSSTNSGKDTTQMVVKKPAEISGIILSNSLKLNRVELSGTPYSATVNDKGEYTFGNIPEGTYSFLTFYANDKSDESSAVSLTEFIEAGSKTTLEPVNLLPNQLLIDDFSDEDDRIKPFPLFAGGWWYIDAINASVDQPGLADKQKAISTSIEGTERYLHISGKVQPIAPEKGQSYVLLGFNLGKGYSHFVAGGSKDSVFYNLAELDSICFKAKGSGKLNLQFATKVIGENGANSHGHFYAEKALTPEWNTHCILSSQIKNLNDTIHWKDSNDEIYGISFLLKENFDFYLDDIVLHGMTLENLFQ